MGCDIHLYKEKKVNGQWVAADKWVRSEYDDDGYEVNWSERFTGRNYQLFGLLAKGVRSEHALSFDARGVPPDVCKEIADCIDGWGSDGHSHSFLTLQELKTLQDKLQSSTIVISGMKDAEGLKAFYDSISSESPDWSKLFPYCQSTNAPDAVRFEVDVPADFYVGHELSEIIHGFDGVGGDDHRIVFFFDN